MVVGAHLDLAGATSASSCFKGAAQTFTGSFDLAFFAAAANISHIVFARQYAYSFSLPG
jgi:hypothetical protein